MDAEQQSEAPHLVFDCSYARSVRMATLGSVPNQGGQYGGRRTDTGRDLQLGDPDQIRGAPRPFCLNCSNSRASEIWRSKKALASK